MNTFTVLIATYITETSDKYFLELRNPRIKAYNVIIINLVDFRYFAHCYI